MINTRESGSGKPPPGRIFKYEISNPDRDGQIHRYTLLSLHNYKKTVARSNRACGCSPFPSICQNYKRLWALRPTSAKINISYSILFHLTTSYSSYFEGKKGISSNKTSFFLLMTIIYLCLTDKVSFSNSSTLNLCRRGNTPFLSLLWRQSSCTCYMTKMYQS